MSNAWKSAPIREYRRTLDYLQHKLNVEFEEIFEGVATTQRAELARNDGKCISLFAVLDREMKELRLSILIHADVPTNLYWNQEDTRPVFQLYLQYSDISLEWLKLVNNTAKEKAKRFNLCLEL